MLHNYHVTTSGGKYRQQKNASQIHGHYVLVIKVVLYSFSVGEPGILNFFIASR